MPVWISRISRAKRWSRCSRPIPDASARAIRQALRERLGFDVAVIISDTFGRPWRYGLVNIAIGLRIEAIKDYTGQLDAQGYELRVTALAIADELAAAAELVMNKLDNASGRHPRL